MGWRKGEEECGKEEIEERKGGQKGGRWREKRGARE